MDGGWCPVRGGVSGQVGRGLGQSDLVFDLAADSPAYGKGLGTGWSLRFLPTQDILWFWDSMMILWFFLPSSISWWDKTLSGDEPDLWARGAWWVSGKGRFQGMGMFKGQQPYSLLVSHAQKSSAGFCAMQWQYSDYSLWCAQHSFTE